MKVHFVWPITANQKMIFMSKLLIKSATKIDAYFTILVTSNQYASAYRALKNFADVQHYTPDPQFVHPWVSTPKWDVKPKGDIVLGLDSDLIVWNTKNLKNYINKCFNEQKIFGTIGYSNPLTNGLTWKELFSEYGMIDDYQYVFQEDNTPAPYYINNGAVLIPSDMLSVFRFYHKKWLIELNKRTNYHFHVSQIANTFAIKESGLPHGSLPIYFNYLETSLEKNNLENDYKKIALFHYNESKDKINGNLNQLNEINCEKLKYKIKNLISINHT
jgi:hypothetical protein